MNLFIAPCEHKAARYAVENWHYSKTMPVGRLVTFGVWESGVFIGAVIFGRGSSTSLGAFINLTQAECCELVRVALRAGHKAKTSKILAVALRVFQKSNPGIKAVVSFADPKQRHKGCIYQATNWRFVGFTAADKEHFLGSKWVHSRETNAGAFGRPRRYTDAQLDQAPVRKTLPKIKYVYCFDAEIKERVIFLSKPYADIDKAYPEGYFLNRADSIAVDAPAFQAGEDGANPISALSVQP